MGAEWEREKERLGKRGVALEFGPRFGNASCASQARRRGRAISCGVISTASIFLNFGGRKRVKRAQRRGPRLKTDKKMVRHPLPIQKSSSQRAPFPLFHDNDPHCVPQDSCSLCPGTAPAPTLVIGGS